MTIGGPELPEAAPEGGRGADLSGAQPVLPGRRPQPRYRGPVPAGNDVLVSEASGHWSLDVSGHVRANPWVSVGVAAGAGFLTGLLIGGGRRSLGASDEMPAEQMHGHVPPSPPQPHHFAASAPPEPRKPGMFDELFAMIGREVRQMAEMALNSAITAAKRNISENVPKLVDGAVSEVMPTGHGVAAADQSGCPTTRGTVA